jgi:hypothetical protein
MEVRWEPDAPVLAASQSEAEISAAGARVGCHHARYRPKIIVSRLRRREEAPPATSRTPRATHRKHVRNHTQRLATQNIGRERVLAENGDGVSHRRFETGYCIEIAPANSGNRISIPTLPCASLNDRAKVEVKTVTALKKNTSGRMLAGSSNLRLRPGIYTLQVDDSGAGMVRAHLWDGSDSS